MRPLRLEITGLVGFRATQTIDFGELPSLAVIGESGAGKLSIVETIVFALYTAAPLYARGGGALMSLDADAMLVLPEHQFARDAKLREGEERAACAARDATAQARVELLRMLDEQRDSAARDAAFRVVERELATVAAVASAIRLLGPEHERLRSEVTELKARRALTHAALAAAGEELRTLAAQGRDAASIARITGEVERWQSDAATLDVAAVQLTVREAALRGEAVSLAGAEVENAALLEKARAATRVLRDAEIACESARGMMEGARGVLLAAQATRDAATSAYDRADAAHAAKTHAYAVALKLHAAAVRDHVAALARLSRRRSELPAAFAPPESADDYDFVRIFNALERARATAEAGAERQRSLAADAAEYEARLRYAETVYRQTVRDRAEDGRHAIERSLAAQTHAREACALGVPPACLSDDFDGLAAWCAALGSWCDEVQVLVATGRAQLAATVAVLTGRIDAIFREHGVGSLEAFDQLLIERNNAAAVAAERVAAARDAAQRATDIDAEISDFARFRAGAVRVVDLGLVL